MGRAVHFKNRGAVPLFLGFLVTLPALGADFGFSTTIRAGLDSGADWELGIGPAGNNTQNSAHVNGAQYYPDNLPTRFEMGYTSATNTAFLRYYYYSYAPLNQSVYTQINYSTAAPGLGANSTWTLPASSFFVSAARRPAGTGVVVDQLTLSGVQVLQPFSTTTLSAIRPDTTPPSAAVLTGMGNNVVFRTGATGDWLLSGRIAFSGLTAHVGGQGATRSQLQLLLSANGASAETPEPLSITMAGLGIAGLAALQHRRNRARRRSR